MQITTRATVALVGVLLIAPMSACAMRDNPAAKTASPSSEGLDSSVSALKARPRTFVRSSFDNIDANATLRYATTLRTDPVPSGTVAKVSRDSAIAAAADADFQKDLQPGTPTMALRNVTLGDEASVTTTSISWVMVWSGSKPFIRGPAAVTQSERERLASDTVCVFIMIVDATTSKVLDARQICRAKP